MESLLDQLRALPEKLKALDSKTKNIAFAGGVGLLLVGLIAAAMTNNKPGYAYVFTSLTTEDSAEVAGYLRSVNIPFMQEANGEALSVPKDRVHEVRLMLAAQGLPRAKAFAVGYELFDRSDLGVSEFTQKVNLQRAIKGELERTIGSLEEIRSAKVTLRMTKKGLFRDEDQTASASVVVWLQPGRKLGNKELAGVRHLTSSSIPGLEPEDVTIVDGRGAVLLQGDEKNEREREFQRSLETDFETRIVSILERVVGEDKVVARVTASIDITAKESTANVFDAENPVLRSERSQLQTKAKTGPAVGGLAGAAANAPLAAGGPNGNAEVNNSQLTDETRNYEISQTTTKTRADSPKLKRLSIAVLLDANVQGATPPTTEELKKLEELAKRAVGFDEERGDQFQLSSVAFVQKVDEGTGIQEDPEVLFGLNAVEAAIVSVFLLLALGGLGYFLWRRRKELKAAEEQASLELMAAGGTVRDIEDALDPQETEPEPEIKASVLREKELREHAVSMVQEDPRRAAYLLRAWIEGDRVERNDKEEVSRAA
jgi:flagellar M-ring protein FliF